MSLINSMTLVEFSERWNELRNLTLGRGLKPLVSDQLAKKIGEYYERWRAWYMSAPPSEALGGTDQFEVWRQRFNELATLARAEGVNVTDIGAGIVQDKIDAWDGMARQAVRDTHARIDKVGAGIAWAVAFGLGIPMLAAVLLSTLGNRNLSEKR